MPAGQPDTSPRTVVVGLGSMGMGMAQSLHRAGLPVWGFDIDPAMESAFRRDGGLAGSRDEVLSEAELVVCVVVNEAQTEAVLFAEDGIADRIPAGAVFLSSATVSPAFARDMAAPSPAGPVPMTMAS